MIPVRILTSRKTHKTHKMSNRKSFIQIVECGKETEIAEYFDYIYGEREDLLTTVDIAEITKERSY